MGLTSNDLKRGRLIFRCDELNPRHARVAVFDQGARAGTLTLDRETWEAIVGQSSGESIGMRLEPMTRRAAEKEGEHG